MNNVLVSGANRGIGLAFVAEYPQRGSRVIATCRQASQANQLHELHQTYGEALIILRMDVADPQQIAACQTEVAKRVDALHVLINNAGILRQSNRLTDQDAGTGAGRVWNYYNWAVAGYDSDRYEPVFRGGRASSCGYYQGRKHH